MSAISSYCNNLTLRKSTPVGSRVAILKQFADNISVYHKNKIDNKVNLKTLEKSNCVLDP